MNRRLCIVSVLDSVSETSMPLNEFLLYRVRMYPGIKQVVIICDKENPNAMSLPEALEIYYVGNKVGKIKKIFRNIVDACTEKNVEVIVHLHQIILI
mgnify:FL=1